MKTLASRLCATLVASLFAATLTSAQAAVVTLTNIRATWFDATPAANIDGNVGGGSGNTTIYWGGQSALTLDSGYSFTAAVTAGGVVPPSPSSNFSLGSFSHINQPVASSITAVKLRLTADIDVGGTGVGNRNFVFQFLHDETPNAAPCPYGPTDLTGVNANGCADRVQVVFTAASDSFDVGGDNYTVNVVGFDSGGGLPQSFLTAEAAVNTASLVARVTLRSALDVPEPGTLALVGLSLFALAAATPRRRA